ncbi:MAG: hypothetical protein ABJA66_04055 [Actinomycetota bacterium]
MASFQTSALASGIIERKINRDIAIIVAKAILEVILGASKAVFLSWWLVSRGELNLK